MNWRINFLILILILFSCKEGKSLIINNIGENQTYLIEVENFKAIADNPNIKIIDFRKKDMYAKAHIANSLNIWRTDIEDSSYHYGGMMANKQQIETLFGNLGIKNEDTLVIYDDNGLCDSARLWWVLQNYGFKNVKLLNGGIQAWKAIGGQMSSEVPVVTKTSFKLPEETPMDYNISKEQVLKALSNSDVVILDTRSHDEFFGKQQKKGAAKAGRIPNSTHLDWAEAINYNGDMKIKPIEKLETIYSKLDKNDTIIVYCHSGVRSAHTTFVLTQLLNYKNVKNYDGSWTEWSHFEEFPFKLDSITIN